MNPTVIAAHINTLRVSVGTLQAQIDLLELMLELESDAPVATGCPHAQTEEVGTFGSTETRCVACHQAV